MNKIKAVIFDMDGVLVQSESVWKDVGFEFLNSLAPTWTKEDQLSIIGLSLFDSYRFISARHNLEISYPEYVQHYKALSGEIYGTISQMIPGVDQLINDLFSKDIRLAICSSSPKSWIEIVVKRFSWDKVMSCTVSAEDLEGKRGKPEPDIYLLTLNKLGLEAADCLAIEDSKRGIISAMSADIKCLGLINGFNSIKDVEKADLVIEGFGEEGVEIIKNLLL